MRVPTLSTLLLLALASGAVAEVSPSPAERQIERAQRALAARADDVQALNHLALSYARRARETADPAFYSLAERTVARSLEIEPANLEAQRVRVWILLGQHEFGAAFEVIEPLYRRFPDDLTVSALRTDALIQLGRYAEAEETAQWLLDLRPGSVQALTRGAHVRELLGDLRGALDWMGEAYAILRLTEVEDRAWVLTQIAHLRLELGELAAAEANAEAALEMFPDYHYALSELADVRMAQGRHAEAARLRRRHCDVAPHPENFFYLGEALRSAGALEESAEVLADFERQALAESESNDNANHELIRYYLEIADRPGEALRLARAESERRRDIDTLRLLERSERANELIEEAEATREAIAATGLVTG